MELNRRQSIQDIKILFIWKVFYFVIYILYLYILIYPILYLFEKILFIWKSSQISHQSLHFNKANGSI